MSKEYTSTAYFVSMPIWVQCVYISSFDGLVLVLVTIIILCRPCKRYIMVPAVPFLFSFRCVIRRLPPGVATAADGQVRFVLRDLETADEMLLYVTLSDLSYPLGLLPGACVAFTNVNVHPPSSRGNMYGYYTCASSARVIDVGTICCRSRHTARTARTHAPCTRYPQAMHASPTR